MASKAKKYSKIKDKFLGVIGIVILAVFAFLFLSVKTGIGGFLVSILIRLFFVGAVATFFFPSNKKKSDKQAKNKVMLCVKLLIISLVAFLLLCSPVLDLVSGAKELELTNANVEKVSSHGRYQITNYYLTGEDKSGEEYKFSMDKSFYNEYGKYSNMSSVKVNAFVHSGVVLEVYSVFPISSDTLQNVIDNFNYAKEEQQKEDELKEHLEDEYKDIIESIPEGIFD